MASIVSTRQTRDEREQSGGNKDPVTAEEMKKKRRGIEEEKGEVEWTGKKSVDVVCRRGVRRHNDWRE